MLRELTDWAAERGVGLPGLMVRRPEPRGRLPGAHQRGRRTGGSTMSGVALVLHQFRFDQKVFWRNPAAVFFTAALP